MNDNDIIPSDPSQANPAIVALMAGIKSNESGGNYNQLGDKNAQGQPTAAGVGQWSNEDANGVPQALTSGQIPTNFANDAKQYGLDTTDFSPANQNKVMYAVLATGKKQGLTPEQILSKWNSGGANTYLTAPIEKTSVGSSTTQDVGKYVKNGMAAAQAYAKAHQNLPGVGNLPTAIQQPGTQTAATGTNAPTTPPAETVGGDIAQGNYGGAALQGAKDVGNFILPSVGDLYHDVTGTNTKTGLQQLGDLGTTALSASTLIPGIDAITAPLDAARLAEGGADVASKAAPTLLGSIGKNAAIGAGFGVSGALGSGQTDPGQIVQSGLLGAGTGGVVGAAGDLISKAAQALPQRIVRSIIPGINEETAQYAVKKGLGSAASMLKDSDASIKSLGSSLGSVLTHPQYSGIQATADDILLKVIQQFPNAGLTPESVAASLMKIAPLQKNLIDKLAGGEGLSLDDLHTLNSSIGQNTFKSVFDDPAVKAGKQVGSAFYHAASNFITSKAPESAELFNQLSKEYPLNAGLQKAIRAGQKAKTFNLRDLMAIIAGFSTAGPIGAGVGLVGEKALTNPTVNLKTAGLLGKISGSGVRKATPFVSGLLSHALGGQGQ